VGTNPDDLLITYASTDCTGEQFLENKTAKLKVRDRSFCGMPVSKEITAAALLLFNLQHNDTRFMIVSSATPYCMLPIFEGAEALA
jgi:hypothetical protein